MALEGKNGNGSKFSASLMLAGISLAVTIMVLVVSLTLAFGNKADRDKVTACELKIGKLESADESRRLGMIDLNVKFEKILDKQDFVIEQLAIIKGKLEGKSKGVAEK